MIIHKKSPQSILSLIVCVGICDHDTVGIAFCSLNNTIFILTYFSHCPVLYLCLLLLTINLVFFIPKCAIVSRYKTPRTCRWVYSVTEILNKIVSHWTENEEHATCA